MQLAHIRPTMSCIDLVLYGGGYNLYYYKAYLTLYQPMMHICVMSSHKLLGIYNVYGGLILGVSTLYWLFCFFKQWLAMASCNVAVTCVTEG